MNGVDAKPARNGEGPGRLVIVPTPIGNLGDMTFRAIDALREADHIFAEDTRRTRQLMSHFEVPARGRLHAMPAEREASRVAAVLTALDLGESVAVVSDAGMPGISDPGALLVRVVLDAGHHVDVLPGASAVPVAIVASGIPAARFTFCGFPPRKQGERHQFLSQAMSRPEAAVFYEAPGRVRALLATVVSIAPDRQVAIGRELTKMHETWIRSNATDAAAILEASEPRGEYVVVIAGSEPKEDATPDLQMIRAALAATPETERPRARAKQAARALGISTQVVYEVLVGGEAGGVGVGAPFNSATQ